MQGRVVALPDRTTQTDIRLYDAVNPAITRVFQYSDMIRLGISLLLSNYLYKIY